MQTAAPAWAIASAMPRPMPLLPPVTIAVLPVRSKALYAMAEGPFIIISLSPQGRGQGEGWKSSGPHAMSGRPHLAQRRGQLGELAEQRTGGARVDDLLDPERLRRTEGRAKLLQPLLDLDHLRGGVGGRLDVGAVGRLDAALERQRAPAPRRPR